MTKERCYTYRINFVDGYYYYGKRKLKGEQPLYDGYYGTPMTNKEKWNTTMYWKEVIQEYDNWEECSKSEIVLIRPVLNEELCLNENCGGWASLEIMRENGRHWGKTQPLEVKKANGIKARDEKLGMFSLTPEERKELSREIGIRQLEEGKGIHKQTIEDKKKLGEYCRDNKIGFHSLTPEERSDFGKKIFEEGKGIFSYPIEERKKWHKKAIEASIEIRKQKWMCTVTGFVSNPYGLSKYQNNRGIDKKNRTRIS